MKRRDLLFLPGAQVDILEAIRSISREDRKARPQRLMASVEAFIRSLAEFADIGIRYRATPYRLVEVPGLHKTALVFSLTDTTVTVIRVGSLRHSLVEASQILKGHRISYGHPSDLA